VTGSNLVREWAKALLSPTRYTPLTLSPATLGSTASLAVEFDELRDLLQSQAKQLQNQNDQYLLIKKNFYDLINE
jgi:hypothetical protein